MYVNLNYQQELVLTKGNYLYIYVIMYQLQEDIMISQYKIKMLD